MEALVDPGSSASIMSYDLFKQIGPKAGISAEDLHNPLMWYSGTIARIQ